MSIKKIKINEDFEDRLGYLIKQHQSGWLCIDEIMVSVLNKKEYTIDEWQNKINERLVYVTQQRVAMDDSGKRNYHTQSNEIADAIFNTLYNDIKEYYVNGVSLRYILNNTVVLSGTNAISLSIPFSLKYYSSDSIEIDEEGSNISYPIDTKFDTNGDLFMNITYTFTLNGKPVNGKLLSLLTDIETV